MLGGKATRLKALGLSEILSYTSPDNERSQAVMAKLNLVRDPARDFMTLTPSGEQWQGLVWLLAKREADLSDDR
jgi:RimJ/RimL family protein N-acetyltransferase